VLNYCSFQYDYNKFSRLLSLLNDRESNILVSIEYIHLLSRLNEIKTLDNHIVHFIILLKNHGIYQLFNDDQLVLYKEKVNVLIDFIDHGQFDKSFWRLEPVLREIKDYLITRLKTTRELNPSDDTVNKKYKDYVELR
jgi:hypothetical protein